LGGKRRKFRKTESVETLVAMKTERDLKTLVWELPTESRRGERLLQRRRGLKELYYRPDQIVREIKPERRGGGAHKEK